MPLVPPTGPFALDPGPPRGSGYNEGRRGYRHWGAWTHAHGTIEQTDLFGSGLPDGFRLWAHLIAPAEEQELVEQLKALPIQPFQFHGFEGKRRVVSFARRYDFNGGVGGLQKTEDIPAFLQPLRVRAARPRRARAREPAARARHRGLPAPPSAGTRTAMCSAT